MQLSGYQPVGVTPGENASGRKVVQCLESKDCSASFKFDQNAGWYTLNLQYFDQTNGQPKFRVYLHDQLVDAWVADEQLPRAVNMGGDFSMRRTIKALSPGDEIRIEGIPDRQEPAPLDY